MYIHKVVFIYLCFYVYMYKKKDKKYFLVEVLNVKKCTSKNIIQ